MKSNAKLAVNVFVRSTPDDLADVTQSIPKRNPQRRAGRGSMIDSEMVVANVRQAYAQS